MATTLSKGYTFGTTELVTNVKLHTLVDSATVVFTGFTNTGTLTLANAADGTHLKFTGDPTVATPVDGDLWFDGTNLKIRIGATTYNIDKTAE